MVKKNRTDHLCSNLSAMFDFLDTPIDFSSFILTSIFRALKTISVKNEHCPKYTL